MYPFLKKKYLLTFTIVALIYFSISIYLINYRIILLTLLENSTIPQKIKILSAIITGSLQIFPLYELILISVISILVGANISIVLNQLRELKQNSNLKITTGGASLIALVGSGCTSCGISILSVLGISTAFIPVNTNFFQLITIALLVISLIYNINNLKQTKDCKIT